MKILIFSWRGPGHPHEGGAEQSTLEHAKYWIKKGNEVWWFTSSFPDSKEVEDVEGVKVVRKGNQILGVHIRAFFWYVFGKHPKFGLVVDQFHGIPFFTPFFVRTKKLAFIHEVAKDVWMMNALKWPLNIVYGLSGKIAEPLVFKFYKKIPFFTVSESTKNDLINFGIDRKNISVIRNGLTVPKGIKLLKKRTNTIIYLGALAKDKGIDDAIKIFRLLWKKDKKYKFWVVGKGEHQYTVNPPITYFGFVNEQKKFELLSEATVLVNPSVREGWGLVNIEAAFCRTPVVGYIVPGVVDSVIDGKTGILVKKNDVRSASREINSLMVSKKKYNKMSANAAKWAKNFSWEKAGKESLMLIEYI